MRSILASNPATRRVMEENPEVARALNDPESLRTMAAAARNPQLMREMMRNNDRQMAYIESLPGGYDALRRPARPRYPDIHGPAPEGCRWSENSARQLSVPERFGLSVWLKARGIDLA